jgi:hypothetical protein
MSGARFRNRMGRKEGGRVERIAAEMKGTSVAGERF